ncbi:beta-propeller domain-containing protein [Patescibacteria group bacterium]
MKVATGIDQNGSAPSSGPAPGQVSSIPPAEENDIKTPSRSSSNSKIVGLIVLLVFFGLITTLHFFRPVDEPIQIPPDRTNPLIADSSFGLDTFSDEEEFKNYLSVSTGISSMAMNGGSDLRTMEMAIPEAGRGVGQPLMDTKETLRRVSDTNVQVMGIDEPDIVKTDGRNIYYSSEYPEHFGVQPNPAPFIEDDVESSIYRPTLSQTKIISALPPENISEITNIPENGDMLLADNVLIVFSGDRIIGYDVSNPSSPKESWKTQLEDNNRIQTSRLFGDKLYLVTNTMPERSNPCPMPLLQGVSNVSIACTDIYRPNRHIPVDSVFTVMQIDPSTGRVEDKTSFVGSLSSTVVYMSPNAMYVAFNLPTDMLDIILDFFITEADDVLPPDLIDRLKKVKSYDISSEAKMLEFQKLFEEYENTLDDDSQLEDIIEKRLEDYVKRNARELTKTGIVKVDINDFDLEASSAIPGSLLNQFSLDEHQGNLRVATTVGGGMFGSTELNENDLYILDDQLKSLGYVQGMGVTERIHSVRFIGDKGYIVTFRRIDPFYVLDLSDPSNPQIKGELKIPGFSSYLHPISGGRILGIGEEGNQVKVSLFNVDNPSNPIEASKYQLDDYWSEISNTHHAFLLDPENEIFFLPGSNKGYVFSYSQDVLSLKKELTDFDAQRALYINDYLYIVGRDKILVFDENTWSEIGKLEFN